MTPFGKLGILWILTLAACSSTAPLQNRWYEAHYEPDQPPLTEKDGKLAAPYLPKVMISSYETPQETDNTTWFLKDLGDRGQSSLMESLEKLIAAEDPACGTKNKPPCRHETLLNALGISSSPGQNASKGPPTLGSVEATSFKRTIVINVLNGTDLPPGDRLQQFTVQLQLQPGAFFSQYTIAQTQSATSKFGSVTQTTQMNLSGKIDPTLSRTVTGTGEVAAGYSNGKTVESDITEASIPLNVNLQEGNLFIQKRGSAVTDITGNTLVALTMTFPKNPQEKDAALVVRQQTLFNNGVTPLPRNLATLAVDYTHFAPDDKDVTADVSLDFLLRHITSKASTYTEGDDSVTFYKGTVDKKNIILIPRAEIVGNKWVILAESQSQGCHLLEATPFVFAENAAVPLYFSNEVSARSFVTWLNEVKAVDINAHQLTFKVDGSAINWPEKPVFSVVNRTIWKAWGKLPSRHCH